MHSDAYHSMERVLHQPQNYFAQTPDKPFSSQRLTPVPSNLITKCRETPPKTILATGYPNKS